MYIKKQNTQVNITAVICTAFTYIYIPYLYSDINDLSLQ